MRKIFVMAAAVLLAAGTNGFCGDDLLPERTRGPVIMRRDAGGESARPAVYNLKRWTVEESADPVQRALGVYKKKSETRYNRRVWITNKADGTKKVLVEFTAGAAGGNVVFSPDEDFMYYLGVDNRGYNYVYGVNLLSSEKFTLGDADHFSTVNCPDKRTFVVLENYGKVTTHHVYTASGQEVKEPLDIKSPVDLEKSLCR
ncbi:MAG: hypothetical protein Q8Q08_03525 [Candidatus Omnitrophota bacterium]|nr:hypothetical protein [Candidatus Omnitrophota bacterium]MDZ4243208.1 hypothetical protein [Candidatus Omnitrophota bacterium]